jgi:hypothetical protein
MCGPAVDTMSPVLDRRAGGEPRTRLPARLQRPRQQAAPSRGSPRERRRPERRGPRERRTARCARGHDPSGALSERPPQRPATPCNTCCATVALRVRGCTVPAAQLGPRGRPPRGPAPRAAPSTPARAASCRCSPPRHARAPRPPAPAGSQLKGAGAGGAPPPVSPLNENTLRSMISRLVRDVLKAPARRPARLRRRVEPQLRGMTS